MHSKTCLLHSSHRMFQSCQGLPSTSDEPHLASIQPYHNIQKEDRPTTQRKMIQDLAEQSSDSAKAPSCLAASSPCSQSCSALHWAAEPEKWQLLLLGGTYPSVGLIWILEAIHQQRNILEQIISKFWDVLTEQLIIRFLQVQRSGILWPRKSSLSCTKPSQSRVLGQRAAAAPAAVVPFKLLSNILKLSKQLCNLAPKSTRISPGMFNQKAQRIQPRSSRPTQTQSSQSTDLL